MESLDKSRQIQHIIIDIGSNSIKCGFNYEPYPRYIIPNVIGKIKSNSFSPIMNIIAVLMPYIIVLH